MFIFLFVLFILLVVCLPWVAVLRPPSKPAWLMALYLIASAIVVLSGYITNSLHVLNQRWAMLGAHLLIGGLGWLVWKRVGSPSPWEPFREWQARLDLQWLRRQPALALLALGITVSYGFAFVQGILIPQNDIDSLSTHLSRIVFWRQNGSFFPWPTFMRDQIWYPVNAQLQTYWTLLFSGSDRLVGAVQWSAALISGIGVFGMARLLGYCRRRSAFAALIFLSFPLIALQSATAQTDLVTVAFFIPAVYFLILGVKQEQNSLLVLSGISVGLGIGVKKSYFLLLPALAAIVLLITLQFGRRSFKQLAVWSLNLLLCIALLGAYMYLVNWWYWGNPFGSPSLIETILETPQGMNESHPVTIGQVKTVIYNPVPTSGGSDSRFDGNVFLELAYNAPRLFYQALDTSGLPMPLDSYAHKVKMRLATAIFQSIGFEEIEGTAFTAPGHTFSFSQKNINEESHAWYGPLSVLLLFPALFLQAWRGWRQRSYLMLSPCLALLIFLPLEIIFRPGWDPFQGRYFAPLFALGAPLMATWFKEEEGSVAYEWLIASLAIVIVTVTLLYNPSKPTLGRYADEFHVWSNNRVFVQTIQRKKDRRVYAMVEKFVPAEATLGYYIPFYFMDYPLFGKGPSRHLIPIVARLRVSNSQWLRAQGIEYILIPTREGYPAPPATYRLISQRAGWKLYQWEGD